MWDDTEELLSIKEIAKRCGISEQNVSEMEAVTGKYRFATTSYYADLIREKGGKLFQDPIACQCIPRKQEIEAADSNEFYQEDPLHEGKYSPVPYLIHKYPDRVLLEVSNSCYMYCRHCTRKNTAINARSISEEEFKNALAYIRRTEQIRDVLISGGDPLTLTDEKLEKYIREIRKISHVQTIRIGTRAIVVNPERITEKLADMLAKYHPIWINTQFNHPREITVESAKACDILNSRGIPLGNQSVLLRGVNDSVEVMEELVLGLIRIRVRPYYLYLTDQVKGTEHFYVDYRKGMDIVEELHRRVSGYAVPRFIIDEPGENGGKTIVEHNHLLREEKGKIVLTGLEKDSEVELYLP